MSLRPITKKITNKKLNAVEELIHSCGGQLLTGWYAYHNLLKERGSQEVFVIGLEKDCYNPETEDYVEYVAYYAFPNFEKFDNCREKLNTMTNSFVLLSVHVMENYD